MTDTCTCPPDDCHGGHTIHIGIPQCAVCQLGIVDGDLVHIEHPHRGEIPVHNECLPTDVMLTEIEHERQRAALLQTRITNLTARLNTQVARRRGWERLAKRLWWSRTRWIATARQARTDTEQALRAGLLAVDRIRAGEQVTDPDELTGLPIGSVVIDQTGAAWQRWDDLDLSDRWWAFAPQPGHLHFRTWTAKYAAAALIGERGEVRLVYVPDGDQDTGHITTQIEETEHAQQ